ncbi:hypothetical protein QCA50_014935 [Cerrena zonata]|uniref:Uncharacterized protein n=1 Tax=Cerrena zonata TaxID=2478898 RepID=A0AAW0FXC2_9APHY
MSQPCDRLGNLVKTFYLFVVDLLHEIELGVWKALLIHLIQILVAVGGNAIQNFNERFHLIPTFGCSTIRNIRSNVSALKKIAARDFEDYLQCTLPVLEGLFPDPMHDRAVQDLVFILAEWHANAKLRLYTTTTVDVLSKLTHTYGVCLRHFANHLSMAYNTKELPKEEAACIRRRAKQAGSKGPARTVTVTMTPSVSAKVKRFQLATYKLHAMGDYVEQITRFGTTDSYSTQVGELEHRSVKRYYGRTNKINHMRQIAQLYRRECILKKALERRVDNRAKRQETQCQQSINNHHHISQSRNFSLKLGTWLRSQSSDARYNNFLNQLLNHLVGRLLYPGMADNGTQYPAGQQSKIMIVNGRIFNHKMMQVNYTTYDMRREYDIINSNKHADIMTVSSDFDAESLMSPSGHPFSYAHVIGIYHAEVVHILPGNQADVQSVQFLRVHRYRHDTRFKAGFQHRRLHCLELMPPEDEGAFGFIDPDEVIRGVHVIPAFHHGIQSHEHEVPQQVPPLRNYYYVNCFVDRDMYMRFRGGGVGHVKIDVDDPTPADIDPLDLQDDVVHPLDSTRGGEFTEREGDGDEGGEDEDEGEDELDEDEDEPDEDKDEDVPDDDTHIDDALELEVDDSEIIDLVNDTLGYADL